MQKCTRTQNKNFVKRFLVEKRDNKRQRKKKKFQKGGKEKAMRKHRETKKRTSGFRKNKRKNKEAKKTLCKKENVEKVFWSGNSEELQKRKCQNEPTQIFKGKKVFSDEKKNRKKEKTQRNISPFQKDQKVETNGKIFQKKVCKKGFFSKKKRQVL